MPIRRDLRHLYRGPEYAARRESILLRANNCCERCTVYNHDTVVRIGGWWHWAISDLWLTGSPKFNVQRARPHGPSRTVRIVLTIAHLDHDPHNNADANLAALCQWCHLHHDRQQHGHNRRVTRAEARGQEFLFAEAAARI